MPGPKPTPTSQLARRGSWRAATRPDEPSPAPVTIAEPPADLPDTAKAVWNALAPSLIASGVLTVSDVPSFTRLCRISALWQTTMANAEGNPDRANVLALSKIEDMMRRLDAAFGLTPADRTGIKVPDAPKTDGKAKFFERRAS